ncbi:MAG: MotA/TolQ/ExbB proton channel family protein [Gammaproteobacteria bacterium]|nr:MotA/TolQ/ExbB proton channel family protein [Gammaproteobacteria bacterium]
MKHLLTTAALLAALMIAPVQAQSLDQLLEQVRTGSLQKTQVAADLEKQFAAAGAGKAGIVSNLKAQRASLEAESGALEDEFAKNEEELNALRTLRERELGDLNDLFGSIQQIVGEAQAGFETSIISAQYPNRVAEFGAISKKISQSNDLLSIEEMESVFQGVFNELAQQGKVTKFTAQVATAAGDREQREVTRVGVFNLIGDGKFLTYGSGGVAELPRQPDGRFLSQAADLEGAAPGGTVEFSVDPTKGTLLGAAVERPSVMERVAQGGLVGYIILGVGAIAALIAIFKIVTLMGVASAVQKQAANPNSPSTKNPLGRVLKVALDHPDADTEAMELKLSEAIMKETPKLTSWLMFLKIVSVVAPLAGLLGTVLGMIETFQSITLFGAGDPKLMAGGISQALVTTVCGLVVAIPIVLLHTAAASKAKRVEEILEEQSAGMVARQIES